PHLRKFCPEVPEALDRLVFDLMAKDPAERPVDAHRVQALLEIISRSLVIPIPEEPTEVAGPLSTAPRSSGEPWQRRVDLFERMLSRAFPGLDGNRPQALGGGAILNRAPPPELARTLEAIRIRLREVDALRAHAFEEQQRLESI